jgi:hypothetical protein
MTFINRIVTINPEETKTTPDSDEMTFGDYCKIHDDRVLENRKNPWARLKVGAMI